MSEGTALNARGAGRPIRQRRALAIDQPRSGCAHRAARAFSSRSPRAPTTTCRDASARVANVQGLLRHAPDERAGDWSKIGLNYPVAQGDNLYVDRDARRRKSTTAVGSSGLPATRICVSRLDDRQLALFVAAGRVIVRVRVLEADDSVRIDTPATQIALVRPGLYRIDVAAGSPLTSVIVREGEAQVTTPAGVETVCRGRRPR